MIAVTLDEWKKKLEFPTGETVILHNPKVKLKSSLIPHEHQLFSVIINKILSSCHLLLQLQHGSIQYTHIKELFMCLCEDTHSRSTGKLIMIKMMMPILLLLLLIK